MKVKFEVAPEEIQQMIYSLKDKDDDYIEMILTGIPDNPITLEDVRKNIKRGNRTFFVKGLFSPLI